jgi:hypothetical protein
MRATTPRMPAPLGTLANAEMPAALSTPGDAEDAGDVEEVGDGASVMGERR